MVDNDCSAERTLGRCCAQCNALRFDPTSFFLVCNTSACSQAEKLKTSHKFLGRGQAPTNTFIPESPHCRQVRNLLYHKWGPYRTDRYRPRIDVIPVVIDAQSNVYGATALGRYSLMSSKYNRPEPPDDAAPLLLPKPMVILSTFARLMP